eukprot:CAMPEP_0179405832 /NCGR_PEP_ID=MMETSP0799-20121207/520_1 /TAXON_ID=46947 /ORGANISM="Geminigera cryophila, Strain CCMP2564" /LENGTH=210 /DNA_ID=CAMNT_0021176753 /DNA_START=230 /DNA_END=858 /DNA_ORIENTATION=-
MSASATSWSSTSTDETSTDETRATVIFVGDENHDVGAVAAVHQIANTAHANGLAVAHFVQHQGGIEYEASSRANSEIPQSPLMPGSRTRSPSATPVPQPNTLATPAAPGQGAKRSCASLADAAPVGTSVALGQCALAVTCLISLVAQTACSETFWPAGLSATRVVFFAARSGSVRVPVPSSPEERKGKRITGDEDDKIVLRVTRVVNAGW